MSRSICKKSHPKGIKGTSGCLSIQKSGKQNQIPISQIKRRNFLKITSVSAAGFSLLPLIKPRALHSALKKGAKPNLLFIMTDQQRFDAMGRMQSELPWYKGKTRLRTPNLDRLSKEGAYFRRAYTQCAVCAPVRTVLRTGCTVERTGAQSNSMVKKNIYSRMSIFKDKIEKLETFEHILVEELGYTAEYYGKWHLPIRFQYTRDGSRPLYQYNSYDWNKGKPGFEEKYEYKKSLQAFKNKFSRRCTGKQQINTYSDYPYEPVSIDARYGMPPGTPLKSKAKGGIFDRKRTSQGNLVGRDSLTEKFTPSYFEAAASLKALDRLAVKGSPFVLTCSFHNPHAPFVATGKYFDYYWKLRKNIYVPESITDTTNNSDYVKPVRKRKFRNAEDPQNIQELSVCYYALCEEIDHYVGKMLKKLDEYGIADNTMIIFLSDHGEMLGSHGLVAKSKFLEESAHVPLLIKFPNKIKSGTIINTPVATLDIFATILDYMGANKFDKGDGKSLRRFMEKSSYNAEYDEEVVVTEWDFRTPLKNKKKLERSFGGETNFGVVKGQWKLMMTKNAASKRLDMMYNLEDDPFEMNNLIGKKGRSADKKTICKAEYLRALLLEWMERMDGEEKNFSDPKYNNGKGDGDIAEIRKRTKWKKLPAWVSHTSLKIGQAVKLPGKGAFIRNEYLYIGRSLPGELSVKKITIHGPDAAKISLSEFKQGRIPAGENRRIKLTFKSNAPLSAPLQAELRIEHSEGRALIKIV